MSGQKTKSKIDSALADQASHSMRIDPLSDEVERQRVRIPVSEQRVHVEKEPVVTREVRVGKRMVEDAEQVSGETRHEELKVDKEGNANVSDTREKRAA